MIKRALSGACAAMIVTAAPPTQAATWLFAVSATVNGQQLAPGPDYTPGCSFMTMGCLAWAPWSASLDALPNIAMQSFTDSTTFSWGNTYGGGGYSGTITADPNQQYAFIGTDFSYNRQPCGPASVCIGTVFGTAPVFQVRLVSIDGLAPVPEPSTWTLLIAGFGAIGMVMRRRFRSNGQPTRRSMTISR